MDWSHLTPDQRLLADQIFQELRQHSDIALGQLAALLASKSDEELFGQTEFEVRDRVHQLAAEVIQTAAHQRKKRGTKGRA